MTKFMIILCVVLIALIANAFGVSKHGWQPTKQAESWLLNQLNDLKRNIKIKYQGAKFSSEEILEWIYGAATKAMNNIQEPSRNKVNSAVRLYEILKIEATTGDIRKCDEIRNNFSMTTFQSTFYDYVTCQNGLHDTAKGYLSAIEAAENVAIEEIETLKKKLVACNLASAKDFSSSLEAMQCIGSVTLKAMSAFPNIDTEVYFNLESLKTFLSDMPMYSESCRSKHVNLKTFNEAIERFPTEIKECLGITSETRKNIDSLVEKLSQVNLKDDRNGDQNSNIIKILDTFVNISIEDNSKFTTDDIFLKLLNDKSSAVVAKMAKAIAEIAKTDNGRDRCTNCELIKNLTELLKGDDIEVLIQTTRALSNICYENKRGNKMVQENNGLTHILTILKKGIGLKETEGGALLRRMAVGFLLNFLHDQSALQQKALEENVVPLICSVLEIDGTSEDSDVAMHALSTLDLFNDSGNQFLDERLYKILFDILAKPVISELSEICLDLVHGQAGNENTKLLFAKTGLCELLLKRIEQYGPRCTGQETRSALETACNVIGLIVTGDESMNLLFDDGKGTVYKKLVEWLDSKDEYLQVTAIRGMGNFASTDAHCQLMVDQGMHRKLLQLLRDDAASSGRTTFQHATLSALRNLVIPAVNKSIVLADGLIDVIYPMLDVAKPVVIFKLLGTLRIVIQDQREAAITLGKRDDLIAKAVEWCNTEGHAGIQAEANRLIAWLVINSKDKEVISRIIKHDGIEHLVKMITAQHTLMQNEALMSLSILSAVSLEESEQSLIRAQVGHALLKFFEQRDPQPDPALTRNALTLTSNLLKSKSETLIEHLKKFQLLDVCEKLLKDSISFAGKSPEAR